MTTTRRILALVAALLPLLVAAQNISVSSAAGQNIGDFVLDKLKGNGVHIYNVKFNNATGNISSPQIGTFQSNGYLLLQMDSGVVMTTGNVSVAPGPNNTGNKSLSAPSAPNDSQLNTLLSNGNHTNSCAILDFDFVSISPFVTMNYCFGSEEYPEFVMSSFNDVFAFFVTGPDPTTGQTRTWNTAIIPHTVTTSTPNGIAVAINTVNGYIGTPTCTGCYNTYSDFYVQNHLDGNSGGPNNAQGVQYDGFTQKLSANATLVPCAQYHMHIAVCNVNDDNYDSGVFIESKSFNSPSANVDLSHRYADSIERSQPRVLPLTLGGSDYVQGRVVVSFGGNAVVGTDYTVVTDSNRYLSTTDTVFYLNTQPHSLTFRGTSTANLTHPKRIELYLKTSLCSEHPELLTYDTIRYILVEDDLLRLRDTTIVAYDTCHQVGVEVELGRPPFTFHWMPETGIDFPRQQYSTALITESRNYRVAVADDRGHADTATVTIQVNPRNAIDEARPEPAAPRVYPNPAHDRLSVEASQLQLLELYNVDGTLVLSRRTHSTREWLDTRSLPAGIYTLRVTSAGRISTEKIIIR